MREKLIQASAEHIEQICSLVNSAYRGESSRAGWTTEADFLDGQRTDSDKIQEILADPKAVILLQMLGDEIDGCVYLKNEGQVAYLGMLTVQPERQDQGIGRRLLEAAESWAVENWHSTQIRMTVIVQRESLIQWYERRGYSQTHKKEPFPYGDERFGIPRRSDLEFEVLEKKLKILDQLNRD